ncbi:MAG TPA: hypothetical protein PKO06_10225, partial [Candidatus Ozemobacteraceae bacterium]|nr:hypothetical protein [Candidatus Ozemobacteraceae bacterium]
MWRSRLFHLRSLVALAFLAAVFVAGVAVAQTPETNVPTGSIELLDEINALAEAKKLEVAQCSQTAKEAGTVRLQISVRAGAHRDFIPFLQGLKKTWIVVPIKFSTRLNSDDRVSSLPILLDLEADLKSGAAAETTTPFEEMLRLTEDIPFFRGADDQPSGKELRLLGMSYRAGGAPELQVLATDLEALTAFTTSLKQTYTFLSLARSQISGRDAYSLRLSLAITGPVIDDFLSLFRTTALQGTLREVTVTPSSDTQPKVLVQFSIPLRRALDLLPMCTIGFSPLVQVNARPDGNGDWNVRALYALKMQPVLVPNQLQWPEIVKVLSEPWPPILYPGMEFEWQLNRMTVTVDYTDQSEFSLLRPLIENGGFRVRHEPVRGQAAERPLRVTLTRSGGVAGDRGEATRPADVDGVPAIGEVVSCEDMGGGAVYTVKLAYADLASFLDGVKPHEHRSIESFQYKQELDGNSWVRLSLVRSTLPGAEAVYETVRCLSRAPFPWKRTEAELAEGLRLTSVSVDAKGRVNVAGQTLKSRRIFSDLFPLLEKTAGLKEPFFKSGTYRDHSVGRVMTFEVTAT